MDKALLFSIAQLAISISFYHCSERRYSVINIFTSLWSPVLLLLGKHTTCIHTFRNRQVIQSTRQRSHCTATQDRWRESLRWYLTRIMASADRRHEPI